MAFQAMLHGAVWNKHERSIGQKLKEFLEKWLTKPWQNSTDNRKWNGRYSYGVNGERVFLTLSESHQQQLFAQLGTRSKLYFLFNVSGI